MTNLENEFMQETVECSECAGRGWQGGALRTRDADGVGGIDVNAYKIPCPLCKGTGRVERVASGN
jgi:DnaJ-class molecular chaperone